MIGPCVLSWGVHLSHVIGRHIPTSRNVSMADCIILAYAVSSSYAELIQWGVFISSIYAWHPCVLFRLQHRYDIRSSEAAKRKERSAMSRSLDDLQRPWVATILLAGQTIVCRLAPATEPMAHLLLRQNGYMWDPLVSHWFRTISPLTNGNVRDRAIELAHALAATGWSLNCPDDLRVLPHPEANGQSGVQPSTPRHIQEDDRRT